MKTRIALLAASVGIVALGACTTDPYGQPSQMSKTQQGAVAGAVLGGLIGAGESKQNAVKGAVVGGLVGAVGGSMLDQQEKTLRQQINNPNVTVVNNGQNLTVTLPESILFATDSAAVSAQGQNDLYTIGRNLNQYPNSRIQVIGHTDSTGSAAYNQDLSERRARSVAGILSAAGVATNRISTVGRGQAQPIASNDTVSGRAQNRRVEIIVIPTN
ncbi:OmpA family protein [Paracoccus sulfuroxidans]|uniref:Outer membrane protein OmpA-like peptidoglycan-associated protein n=1 Tax=Paracoccus sulfuroxidans TaxID=384678 RepID=A0A562NYA7_9RHOB|nr:OmpA family protein [Paracoccus sulfuroxidans]TWI37071.1 outer membrane protein OmpA-like peptidoglycan-associated protein [Paracoccus sulfuroxidans]